ncbi:MAG: triose-phosphate isomerase [Aurantimonas endophytica]|uniref:Triosephosphate isomerase n=1 Tax=Aurantimonas endophytica TaxID=1522175 RepID=A0A7W6HAH4_9HYPH|nr:triose-phosphate isomerase [Aurantimonas endophytica]MBB4001492.1 triosephosphate isomerase [Aurantimonas endophytica]MCO6402867.1 triose-phosphate isomerase [Aurantimonas endophytica]
MTRPKPLIAGNWKMNGTLSSLPELAEIAAAVRDGAGEGLDLLICPPATLLSASHGILGDAVAVGGQDCHEDASGAHTGDISAAMLADVGARYVIVGHSERRADHGESDTLIKSKAEAAWASGLVAIVCVGETDAQRQAGQTLDVLGAQLDGSLPEGVRAASTVVAYEPVWAIGTGRTPTVDDVREVHDFIRRTLAERFGDEVAGGVRILYGGSVKPSNAAELLGVDNVDGALVGGASLKAADFVAICRARVAS